MKRALAIVALAAACSPYKPLPTDAGGGTDAAKEAAACVPNFQACTATSLCCTSTFVCNTASSLCEAACSGVNALCSMNSDCCSGICNGTCQ